MVKQILRAVQFDATNLQKSRCISSDKDELAIIQWVKQTEQLGNVEEGQDCL